MNKSKSQKDNKFFIIYFIILFLCIVIWVDWNKYPTISKRDFINQSTDVLEERLLTITPIGVTADDVKKNINSILNRKYAILNYDGPNKIMALGFKSIHGKGDYMIRCNLTTYGWAKNLFVAGRVVDAFWLFDNNHKLKEIVVLHWTDSM